MNRSLFTLTALAAALQGMQVQAQETEQPPASRAGAGTLEEVVVTARKRSESLQDVPLAITAISAAALEKRDIQNLEDVANNTIGMNYNGSATSGYQASPTIRGLATGFLQDRVQNVASFINGVYLQRQSMMNVGMADLERIEVLKGPQNSMYGRSAFAGAINYVTVRPGEEGGGYLSTTQGEDNREDYRGAINVPMFDGALLGRLSYAVSEYDGATRNYHPVQDAGVSGFSNEDNLGGWDDETINAALAWRPTNELQITGEYYKADLKRESQPYYIISGLRDVASTQVSRFDDMNFNEITYVDPNTGTVTGNTLWRGEFPDEHPGQANCILENAQKSCDIPDQRGSNVVVDPRAYGMTADTDVTSLDIVWDPTDRLRIRYLYGYVEHEGSTAGPAERDSLNGAELYDIVKVVHTNISSARPITELETDSHELRFDWEASNRMQIGFGLFYADVEDEQWDFTVFAPLCSDRDQNGDGSNADELAGCSVSFDGAVDNSPLDQISINPFWDFAYANWHGNRGNHTLFNDEVMAVFASIDYDITDYLKLRVEGRYSEEDREIERLTDGFALPPGTEGCATGPIPLCLDSTIVNPTDSETFDYFAPRVNLDWAWSDDSMAYISLAKGVKAGGFNNASSPSQLTYDEEENWTFEIGSKNLIMDSTLKLNAALYYIDWNDIQGSEPPEETSINSNVVTGNIGDATSYGLELESSWYLNEYFSFDFGYGYNKAEYDDGVYDGAQRYMYYRCEAEVVNAGEVCGDADIEGNALPRNSEHQAMAAVNFTTTVSGNWYIDARLSANYQSKQYVTPVNEGYLPSRTLMDGDMVVSYGDSWEIGLWVKNITDEEYAAGTINIVEQNKFMVALGAPRTWGARLRYNFNF